MNRFITSYSRLETWELAAGVWATADVLAGRRKATHGSAKHNGDSATNTALRPITVGGYPTAIAIAVTHN